MGFEAAAYHPLWPQLRATQHGPRLGQGAPVSPPALCCYSGLRKRRWRLSPVAPSRVETSSVAGLKLEAAFSPGCFGVAELMLWSDSRPRQGGRSLLFAGLQAAGAHRSILSGLTYTTSHAVSVAVLMARLDAQADEDRVAVL